MKTFVASLSFVAVALVASSAEPTFTTVFTSGQDGYKSVRIPAVLVTRSNTVLAFAEGRAMPRDQAENDIILKRSKDGGRTWSALQVVAEDGAHSLNNPAPVQELNSGRIFLMYQRIPSHIKERATNISVGYEGTNVYRNFVVSSDDDGATWSKPLDITRTTKRPTHATTIASGPGAGIQLTRGEHRGRLLIPFNEGPYSQWNNYAVFSDDNGASWKYGENVPGAFVPDVKLGQRSQINEVQFVELSDGSVLLNSRQFAGEKVRKSSVSRDGGVTWSPVENVKELRDPSCNGSVFRYSFDDAKGKGRIFFSGPDSTKRENGTIYLSFDDGVTWPMKRVLWPQSFAYSSLARLSDGSVGCLFETDNYGRVLFARIDLAWIEKQ